MSNDIRKYRGIKEVEGSQDLVLTAFVGGERHGHCIQFTIDRKYACLSEKQLLDLIETIAKRLALKQGFCATDASKMKTVLPDGNVISEEDEDE